MIEFSKNDNVLARDLSAFVASYHHFKKKIGKHDDASSVSSHLSTATIIYLVLIIFSYHYIKLP